MSTVEPKRPRKSRTTSKRGLDVFRLLALSVLLGLGIYIALSPSVVYAPTPRIVIYLLLACFTAMLFAGEAAARFEMQLKGFVATATGAAAIMLITLTLLTYLTPHEQQILVFQLYDENQQPVAGLDVPGVLTVGPTRAGLAITRFTDHNTVILIFPEQVPGCELQVRPIATGPTYTGQVSYAGTPSTKLYLHKNLSIGPTP